MKMNKISLFLLAVFCLLSVACGFAANDTRRYNPDAKRPLLDLPLVKRLELAKKYATTEDASFINGVLGSLAREQTRSAEE